MGGIGIALVVDFLDARNKLGMAVQTLELAPGASVDVDTKPFRKFLLGLILQVLDSKDS